MTCHHQAFLFCTIQFSPLRPTGIGLADEPLSVVALHGPLLSSGFPLLHRLCLESLEPGRLPLPTVTLFTVFMARDPYLLFRTAKPLLSG